MHSIPQFPGGVPHAVRSGATTLAVETIGAGDDVLLVHGFPHTRAIWRDVAGRLAADGMAVAAVDLRGMGDNDRAAAGYDLGAMADDLAAVIEALGQAPVHAVGIDLGASAVFALAAIHPELVASLVLIEATVGTLPGAESFFAGGPPWWFGFHQAPGGIAERVVAGNENDYVRFFLEAGSRRGVPEDVAAAIVGAYRRPDGMRCAFEYYRAMPVAAQWISRWAGRGRLRVPVMTIGADTVGDATARQIGPLTDDLQSELLSDCGHIVCVDQPARTAQLIGEFVDRTSTLNGVR